ncbi:hypothetical protein [Pseudomonas entomophila]|uniref:Uncharacterized protein n=2 Tax=Pseudomonas entomophila TaxID=312306 RepID=Q1IFQ9_PSEE4|nr:hypothetical protein [Pseudomonas entomophila]WMW05665.1 hypothetical protein RAH46_25655 [Pseudomonas entomophila]CAK13495.1 hypothetical protein PSEEN0550 [Pseudomonas entomophila L48]
MRELQLRWASGQLIGLDVVYCGAAAVRFIDIDSVENDKLTGTFGREFGILFEGKATLVELLGGDDVWSNVQVNNKLSLESGQVMLCGEGDFVYVQSTHNFCVVLNVLDDEVFIVNEGISTLCAV